MKKRFRLLWIPLILLGWMLAGCTRDDSTPLASELDEPYYKQAQQLKKQGRYQEALIAFLKVIAKRNEDAPESHLEVGLIYSQNVRNYISAIYHFNKYLELQPNSRQADLVRQQINNAKREFARTLPATSVGNLDDRVELQAQVGRLQRENDQLKADLAAIRSGTGSTGLVPEPALPSHASAPASNSMLRLTPVTTTSAQTDSPLTLAPVSPTPAPVVVNSNLPSTKAGNNVRLPPTRQSPTPAPSGRRHTVAVKESLWSIARKYYGASASAAKVQGILDANRDQLPNASALKPGMDLRIP